MRLCTLLCVEAVDMALHSYAFLEVNDIYMILWIQCYHCTCVVIGSSSLILLVLPFILYARRSLFLQELLYCGG
jgi:hypothetical protein